MEMPTQAPVMTLSNATLFPQALLPLYIFEPRYRQMLADVLQSERLFIVAMQNPDRTRETPCKVAGLGLIRVSVDHEDGSSHLILQGLTRVRLGEPLSLKPYRIHAIEPILPPPCDAAVVDPLTSEIRSLVRRRIKQGALPFPYPLSKNAAQCKTEIGDIASASPPPEDVCQFLERLSHPGDLADLVACALLHHPQQRQSIMESVDIESRLKKLVAFLLEDTRHPSKNKPS